MARRICSRYVLLMQTSDNLKVDVFEGCLRVLGGGIISTGLLLQWIA